mgnify:FL=1
MNKSLVIVESPAKVKTISKFLGKNYTVKSSVGHIRDLAKSGSAKEKDKSGTKKKKGVKLSEEEKKQLEHEKLVQRMGVDPKDSWSAQYEILPGKEKVLKSLQDVSKKVGTIYLATDLDREGEAIAWHLMKSIGGDESRYKRVTFTEITKNAVQESFKNPGVLNLDRVNAQQARRFLDRVVGYMLSPLLWQKIARGLSAGRVQSVAVRLISEREQEIHAFKSDEYWEVHADLKSNNGSITMQVVKKEGNNFRPVSEAEIKEHISVLERDPYIVQQVEKKPTKSKPSAPYITSTLQQAASVRLGFGVKKTMILAQQLYEAGHITYMRTDSTNLSKDAVEGCREYVETTFGKDYIPESPLSYSSKKSAQEAHEAIRPTDVLQTPETLNALLDKDAARIYDIIWRQFVACQMTNALYDSTNIIVACGPYELKARGRVLRFDGYLKVQPQIKKKGDDEVTLPLVEAKETLDLQELKPSQHFTKPPPRFTEASLVRELEKKGIGRPSTYASIISTIQDRGYVRIEKRRFFCLKMGEIVTDRLVANFHDLMDYGFTASMEEDLDKIASGGENWHAVLDRFYANFTDRLLNASSAMRTNDPTPTNVSCPECSREMNIRTARTGVFLSCSGYALPVKERCKGTLNLIAGDEVESFSDDEDEGSAEEIRAKERCPNCDTAMDSYLIDEERKIHVCGNNPECAGFNIESGKFRIKGYEGPVITCDKCENDMQLKTGRFGKYFGCTNAPECKNTRKLLRNGEAAPPRADPIHMEELSCEETDGYFVLRDGAAGIFLASSKFPRSRETRKPQVADLIRHKSKLDEKYFHLTSAPAQDDQGNPAIIRFSRKTKEHYVMSEVEGKATGWAMFYENGVWLAKKGKGK